MQRSTHKTVIGTAAVAVCLAGTAGSAHAQPLLPMDRLDVAFVGETPQDFRIPHFYGATLQFIIEGANAVQLADQTIKEGVWDIRKSGLSKARAGLTSLAEVNRVTVE